MLKSCRFSGYSNLRKRSKIFLLGKIDMSMIIGIEFMREIG